MKIEVIKYSALDLNEMIKESDYDNDAGIDIRLKEKIVIAPHSTVTVGCGFGLKLPTGVMAQVITRSSISKQNITIGNAPIDASYTGEIHMMVSNNSDNSENYVTFDKGERLAQLVIIPIINFKLVDSLKLRGQNGLGSSGK